MAELIWEGKYDKDGRRVPPFRVALPFQTVEVVNESAEDRRKGLLNLNGAHAGEWRNRLIWGDKKYVLPSLLPEFAGKVNLIYIDPPFNTDADFSFTAKVPDLPETQEDESVAFTKEANVIEQKAYRDTWGKGLDSYLYWFNETSVLLRDLLQECGILWVHLDHRIVHYVKVLLDEVFGGSQFKNAATWRRQIVRGMKSHAQFMPYSADTLLLYAKGDGGTWNPITKEVFLSLEEAEKKYMKDAGGYFRTSDRGTYSDESIVRLAKQGRIHITDGGKLLLKNGCVRTTRGKIGIKYYRETRGDKVVEKTVADNVWDDVPGMGVVSSEYLGYPTQKPQGLLERIISASSNEGDLVLDCFCGSGTTAAVAEKLGRRWIACDLSRFAIHTTRKRLLQIPNVRPFVVQNLGKYERQAWQAGEFGRPASAEEAAAKQRRYVDFILRLYGAKPLAGCDYIHGIKEGRLVHVGAVDAPVSLGDVKNIAADFRRLAGTGKDAPTTNAVDVLGWDFAFELNEVAKQQALAANVQVKFLRIPRDVMDKRAVEQGDVKFFELAALSVKAKVAKREVTLTLTDFTIPPEDVPVDVRRAVRHWEQWIDYWAVDWDKKDDRFHNEWQAYRTRKSPGLPKEVKHTYPAAGTYTVVVKVIDILGNDTTKTIKVKVG